MMHHAITHLIHCRWVSVILIVTYFFLLDIHRVSIWNGTGHAGCRFIVRHFERTAEYKMYRFIVLETMLISKLFLHTYGAVSAPPAFATSLLGICELWRAKWRVSLKD